MFILIRKEDNVIIGTAANKINTKDIEKNGYIAYEIDNSEFNVEMLGTKLQSFEKVK